MHIMAAFYCFKVMVTFYYYYYYLFVKVQKNIYAKTIRTEINSNKNLNTEIKRIIKIKIIDWLICACFSLLIAMLSGFICSTVQ